MHHIHRLRRTVVASVEDEIKVTVVILNLILLDVPGFSVNHRCAGDDFAWPVATVLNIILVPRVKANNVPFHLVEIDIYVDEP